MGYRAAAVTALAGLGVPCVVWTESEPKVPPGGVRVHVAPFGSTGAITRREAERLREAGPFTHVVACTEASVVAASHARRVLGARRSVHSITRRCHDKLAMKTTLKRRGVPMPDFVDGNVVRDWRHLRNRLGSPLVVKDRLSSGGAGIDIVDAAAGPVVPLRARIVERFIDAPEASVESFVADGRILFDNVTEYYRKKHVNIVPAPATVDAPGGIRALSRQVIGALRIAWGMTHMEAFLSSAGPLFGEIALRPPGGHIMELVALAYGFDAWQAFLCMELGRPFAFPFEPVAHAAAILFHPGAGRVSRVDGIEAIRVHPSVTRARIRVRAGDHVDERTSVSRTAGHVLVRAPDRAALLAAIDDVESTLRIEVEPARDVEGMPGD